MKIAIPSETDAGLESIRSGHFGHAAYMTVVEFDDDMNIVLLIKNKDTQSIKVTVDDGKDSATKTYGLTRLILETE